MNLFNFEKALAAAKDDATIKAFLQSHRATFEQLTQDGVNSILDLIAAGQAEAAMRQFYAFGGGATPQDIAAGAAADVTGTAAMAERATALKARLNAFGVWAVNALLAILAAGFLV